MATQNIFLFLGDLKLNSSALFKPLLEPTDGKKSVGIEFALGRLSRKAILLELQVAQVDWALES